MAVTQNPIKKTLQLKVKTGVDTNNKDVFKTLSFSSIKTDAADDSVYAVATAIGGLLDTPISSFMVADTAELINA